MARMRSMKPEFWTDEELATIPRDARLLYVGLWNLSDEHSRLRGDPRYVKGQLFMYDDDLSAADVEKLIDYLVDLGKVVRYRSANATYLYLRNLARHQRLDSDKVPSRLPPPPDDTGPSGKFPHGSGPDPDKSGPDPHIDSRERDPTGDTWAEQPKLDHDSSSGNFPNKSGNGTKDLALKHVAGSREHVAGSRAHGGISRADARRNSRAADHQPKTDPARQIVTEATGASDAEATRILDRVRRERRPRALLPFVRRMAEDGDLATWLDELRNDDRRGELKATIRAIKQGPPCEHGNPGGALPHPASGKPMCPLCRRTPSPRAGDQREPSS